MSTVSRARFLAARAVVRRFPDTRFFRAKASLLSLGGCDVAPSARIHSQVKVEGSNVRIGKHAWIGSGAFLAATPSAGIVIGEYVDIAPRVTLIVGSHSIGDHGHRAGPGRSRPIAVGNGTWIGAAAVILGGVVIGSGCVVAAGSVVTESFGDDVLLGGVPAKVIRTLSSAAPNEVQT